MPSVLGELHVRVGGTGPAILFWPSLLMDGSMRAAQAACFTARGYRVVLIDPPGAGASEALTRSFSFDECARCIVQILDALRIERAHWVGNSWGGMIGGTLAARHAERIGVAVLMNATASGAGLRHRVEFPIRAAITRLLGGIRPPLTARVIDAFVSAHDGAGHSRRALRAAVRYRASGRARMRGARQADDRSLHSRP